MDIKVPALGESVTEATIAKWFKAVGEAIAQDEPLVELETDKVTLEVPAPASGVLSAISAGEGATVEVGEMLGVLDEGAAAQAAPKPAEMPAAGAAPAPPADDAPAAPAKPAPADAPLSPAVRKLVDENDIDPAGISGSGKGGRILKSDVLSALESGTALPAAEPAPSTTQPVPDAREERVRMTRLRRTIATRLKEAQNTAAMLTTFNEVDMSAVMQMRARYKDDFLKKHGIKLGFMSFFTKACVAALQDLPAVNAEIDGEDIVYKNYYNIGVAVGTERGLVVPVVRDADQLDFAGIEKTIAELGGRAREGTLGIDEMLGGTFTITNGGIYGSLMSTPILNAPQSGILGMHKIQERPMVVNGELVIRPMMYLALSYDHRIVDGKEAVTFLVRVKECIEDPQRLVLDL